MPWLMPAPRPPITFPHQEQSIFIWPFPNPRFRVAPMAPRPPGPCGTTSRTYFTDPDWATENPAFG
jgi:hypothetical protein